MSAISDAQKKKVGVELLYNSVHRKFNQLERRCRNENMSQRGWVPKAPGWAALGEKERNAFMSIRVRVNMFCSVSNSPSHSKIFSNPFEPFQIKWEVYFSK